MRLKYPFADVHNHVLFGVDDGSQSMEESLEMLRIAAGENISRMILTPHFIPGRVSHSPESLQQRFEELKGAAKDAAIPVRLYLGTELYYYEGAEDDLRRGKILTMAGSDRVLVEFYTGVQVKAIRDAVLALRSEGLVPIIAHAERYVDLVMQSDEAETLRDLGAEIQVNLNAAAGGLGSKPKQFIRKLLASRLVSYVGTDAHDTKRRPPLVEKELAVLYRKYDESYIREITYENVCRLVR